MELEKGEVDFILRNPRVIALLMDYHDYEQTQADAMDTDCKGNEARRQQWKAHGRQFVQEDPEMWGKELCRTFGIDTDRPKNPSPAVREAILDREADEYNELEAMRKRKDDAYEERNRVVAALARLFPSGIARTNIEGWSPEWHGCVYIDTPVGQMSWHYHDSQAHLFAGLPPYPGEWDGHTTELKYERLSRLGANDFLPVVKALLNDLSLENIKGYLFLNVRGNAGNNEVFALGRANGHTYALTKWFQRKREVAHGYA